MTRNDPSGKRKCREGHFKGGGGQEWSAMSMLLKGQMKYYGDKAFGFIFIAL